MRLTEINSDIVVIDEHNLEDKSLHSIDKIHIIKLNFETPTEEHMKRIFELFPNTNRFVVDNDVKFYNSVLKNTNKKYYVMNRYGSWFVSFMKKNNKCMLNFEKLHKEERDFIITHWLTDVLRNVEIILINKNDFEDNIEIFKDWWGNVIIGDNTTL